MVREVGGETPWQAAAPAGPLDVPVRVSDNVDRVYKQSPDTTFDALEDRLANRGGRVGPATRLRGELPFGSLNVTARGISLLRTASPGGARGGVGVSNGRPALSAKHGRGRFDGSTMAWMDHDPGAELPLPGVQYDPEAKSALARPFANFYMMGNGRTALGRQGEGTCDVTVQSTWQCHPLGMISHETSRQMRAAIPALQETFADEDPRLHRISMRFDRRQSATVGISVGSLTPIGAGSRGDYARLSGIDYQTHVAEQEMYAIFARPRNTAPPVPDLRQGHRAMRVGDQLTFMHAGQHTLSMMVSTLAGAFSAAQQCDVVCDLTFEVRRTDDFIVQVRCRPQYWEASRQLVQTCWGAQASVGQYTTHANFINFELDMRTPAGQRCFALVLQGRLPAHMWPHSIAQEDGKWPAHMSRAHTFFSTQAGHFCARKVEGVSIVSVGTVSRQQINRSMQQRLGALPINFFYHLLPQLPLLFSRSHLQETGHSCKAFRHIATSICSRTSRIVPIQSYQLVERHLVSTGHNHVSWLGGTTRVRARVDHEFWHGSSDATGRRSRQGDTLLGFTYFASQLQPSRAFAEFLRHLRGRAVPLSGKLAPCGTGQTFVFIYRLSPQQLHCIGSHVLSDAMLVSIAERAGLPAASMRRFWHHVRLAHTSRLRRRQTEPTGADAPYYVRRDERHAISEFVSLHGAPALNAILALTDQEGQWTCSYESDGIEALQRSLSDYCGQYPVALTGTEGADILRRRLVHADILLDQIRQLTATQLGNTALPARHTGAVVSRLHQMASVMRHNLSQVDHVVPGRADEPSCRERLRQAFPLDEAFHTGDRAGLLAALSGYAQTGDGLGHLAQRLHTLAYVPEPEVLCTPDMGALPLLRRWLWLREREAQLQAMEALSESTGVLAPHLTRTIGMISAENRYRLRRCRGAVVAQLTGWRALLQLLTTALPHLLGMLLTDVRTLHVLLDMWRSVAGLMFVPPRLYGTRDRPRYYQPGQAVFVDA